MWVHGRGGLCVAALGVGFGVLREHGGGEAIPEGIGGILTVWGGLGSESRFMSNETATSDFDPGLEKVWN